MAASGNVFHDLGVAKLEPVFWVMITSATACHLIWALGWRASSSIFPGFRNFTFRQKCDWSMRVVSFTHSTLIASLAVPILRDADLRRDPVFGFSEYASIVYAITCGYFVWDTLYSIWQGGVDFIFHGLACLLVYIFSFRPFLQYYGAVFLTFELSTPFLNIHYFCDKSGRTGGTLQWINGIILLATFFTARICFGLYMSFHFFVSMVENRADIPPTLFWLYAVANVVLNSLNLFWFSKMITSVRKRFVKKAKSA